MYKVIRDNEIVDAIQAIQYVRIQHINNTLICCPARYGQGILSENGTDIWYSRDYVPCGNINGYPEVEIEKIDEAEYAEIRATLDEGKAVYEPEPEDVVEADESGDEQISEEPKVKTVSEKINELTDEVEMLTACVLEMSAAVYA